MVLNLKLLVCLSLLLLRVYQRESLRVSFLLEILSTKTDCVFFILIAVSQHQQEHSSENGSEPETSRVLKAAASKTVSKIYSHLIFMYIPHICMYICTFVYVYMCTFPHICMYICIFQIQVGSYDLIFIYSYILTSSQSEILI